MNNKEGQNYQPAVAQQPPQAQSYPLVQQPVHVTYVMAPALTSESTRIKCTSCHAEISTRVEYEPNTQTHIMAIVCCLVACLCCVPYCINSCQSAKHYCPACGTLIGIKN